MHSQTAKPRGTNLSRYIKAYAISHGELTEAGTIAEQWRDSPAASLTLKAQVNVMSTAGDAAALAEFGIAAEYLEIERGASILGRLPAMRRVPFKVKIPREIDGGNSGWVAELEPTPATALGFDNVTVERFKAATIVVIAEELARSATPNAELTIRSILGKGVAAYLDNQFLDPSITRIEGKRPASITNGGGVVISTGPTAEQINPNLADMVTGCTSRNALVWIMQPGTAIFLASLINTAGNLAFPFIRHDGGFLMGIPVITSIRSPHQIALIDSSEILFADDGDVTFSIAKHATVEMNSTPGQASPASDAVLVSLWEHNLVGIMCTRWISWLRGPAGSAVSMQVAY